MTALNCRPYRCIEKNTVPPGLPGGTVFYLP